MLTKFANRTLLLSLAVVSVSPVYYFFFFARGIDLFWLALLHAALTLLTATSLKMTANGYASDELNVSWGECCLGVASSAVVLANVCFLLWAYALSGSHVSDVSLALGGEDRNLRYILGFILGAIWLLASMLGAMLGLVEIRTLRRLEAHV